MADTKAREYQTWKRRLPGSTLSSVATMTAAFRNWRRTVARRTAMADLTPDQLNDIGQAEAPLPKLDVKAGLITNLMSMR